jgi:hypothetical protein
VAVTLYGVGGVTFMMTMYALEHRHPRWILGFAVGSVASSVYGFLPAPGRSAWSSSSGPGSHSAGTNASAESPSRRSPRTEVADGPSSPM